MTHHSPSLQDPGTPEPDFDVEEEDFRPVEEELIDLTAPALPPSIRQRLPHREKECLPERVLRYCVRYRRSARIEAKVRRAPQARQVQLQALRSYF